MRLFDEAIYPVIVHDGIFILHANPLALKLFRFSSVAEIVQVHLLDLLDDVSIPLAQARIAQLRADPESGLAEAQYIFRRADDTRFVAIVNTRSLGWAGDVLRHEIIFRTLVSLVQEVP